jgi:hypothetical protein
VSATDPEASLARHRDDHVHLSYRIDTTVDLETGVVVAAGAAPGEVNDQIDFLQRTDEAVAALAPLGLQPQVMVADKGHHSGENLAGLAERGVVGLIASPGRAQAVEGFRQEDFTLDPAADQLRCPAGQVLRRVASDRPDSRSYRAAGRVCRACPHFGQCTKDKSGRKVRLSVHAGLVEANWERIRSEAGRPLVQIRGQRGEAPFGYMKCFGGLRRLAGRGLAHARKKVLLAAMGWNLLLLVKAVSREAQRTATGTALGELCRLWSALCGLVEAILAWWRLLPAVFPTTPFPTGSALPVAR